MATRIFLKGGTASCVYDDNLRPILEALGLITVERASNVEFESSTGDWVAIHKTGKEIGRSKNRQEAIQQEVSWIENNL